MSPRVPATERILAGFCHDLNGRVAAAEGFLHLLSPGHDPEGPAARLRDLLMELAHMGGTLRALVRDDDGAPVPASLGEILEAVGALWPWHPRGGRGRIHVEGVAELPAVRVDPAAAVRVVVLALDAGGVTGEGSPEIVAIAGAEEVRLAFPGAGTRRSVEEPLAAECAVAGVGVAVDGDGSLILTFPRLGKEAIG